MFLFGVLSQFFLGVERCSTNIALVFVRHGFELTSKTIKADADMQPEYTSVQVFSSYLM